MIHKVIGTFKRLTLKFRFRHRKGHGIHSPFVYSLIRKAFMPKELMDKTRDELYTILINNKVGKKQAIELQNLYNYCHYSGFVIGLSNFENNNNNLHILLPKEDNKTLANLVTNCHLSKNAIAIISPYQNRPKQLLCDKLVNNCDCLSIDNRDYILLFFDKNYITQHFKL